MFNKIMIYDFIFMYILISMLTNFRIFNNNEFPYLEDLWFLNASYLSTASAEVSSMKILFCL